MALFTKSLSPQLFLRVGKHSTNYFLMFNKSFSNIGIHGKLKRTSIMSYVRNVYTSNNLYKRRKTVEERKQPRIIQYSPKSKLEIVDVWRGITLNELARVLERDIEYVKDLFLNQIQNPNTIIDDVRVLQEGIRRGGKRIRIVAKPNNKIEENIEIDLKPRPPPNKEDLQPRPPVVTVMGHVDHGKTTLLDALRHSSVVETEFGGITQHIGAFLVKLDSGATITFLDTPGHAAFTSMRARGANVTDIVVLVVAADDGVMEQTVESIRMAKNAKVPILVAINKIDSPKSNIERTEQMLLEVGIQLEKLGGDTQGIPISALKKKNLNNLIEALVLQAELLQVGGDPTGPVEAVVIESNVHPYRGKLSTIVVQRGTLKKGDILVAGTAVAKVRTIKDADGNNLQNVPPGYPAEIDGWRDLPSAGDIILEAENEKHAKDVVKFRQSILEKKRVEEDLKVIEEKRDTYEKEYKEKLMLKRLSGRYKVKREGPRQPEYVENNEHPSLNVIVRADVDGTLEAILEILDTYDSPECKLDIVNYAVGAVTPTDIELAKTFKCVIYAFNVSIPQNLKPLVEENNIPVKHHNVIYKLIEDFKDDINSRWFIFHETFEK
ncbi:translation initiation factor IF-2, mitochondrial isoform X3 [Sitophilus oryzae]|uniref:Translation initiation factor IF-2, mitochondrial isoform X3 n=1 Tax=Sitophilus oryzae TaxID=7048 RepID=A0A6J2X415_SITOR|nr:translation initiation factor IF-2, mitochondrial isoform X3 [Sitophilus oryzae]